MKPGPENSKQHLNEKRFRALIENAHEGIVQYDTHGKIVFVSKSVKKVCGFNEKEALGKPGTFFVHPDDQQAARDAFEELLKKPGQHVTLIQRLKHKKRGYIWAESLLTNFSHIPEINGIVSNFRDITDKKIAEEKIFQSQELLQTITRNLNEGIYMGVISSHMIYVNDGFLHLLGYKSFKEIEHIKPAEFYADDEQRTRIVEALKKDHVLINAETSFRKKNGDTFPVIINVRLLAHEGKGNYFVGTVRDITRDKQAKKQLVESQGFLNNIINTVAAPIFVKDDQHRWVITNGAFQKLLGKSEGELFGKSDRQFLLASEAKIFWDIDNKVLKSGKTVVNMEKITSAEGKLLELLTVKSRYVNEAGRRFIIGFITDITQLRKTEEEIHQLNANLQGVLESTKESIYAIDRNFNYISFNQNHKRVMKALYGANISVGANKLKFLKGSDDYRWVKAELERAMGGSYFASEHFLEHKKFKGYIHTTFNPIYDRQKKVKGVAVFVNDITQRKEFEAIIRAVNANLSAVMESTADRIFSVDKNFRYVSFNQSHAEFIRMFYKKVVRVGMNILDILPDELAKFAKREISRALKGEHFISEAMLDDRTSLEVSYNPIYDDTKRITGVAVFARDITERKRTELELLRLNQELVHQNNQLASQEEELKATLDELSERNFELDQLMYKTSHDLRSPLSSIMGLVNLARLDSGGNNQGDYLNKIEDRIKKLDEFIRSMLDYARVNRVEVSYEKVDLNEVARNCIHELEYLENFSEVKTQLETTGDSCITTDPLRIAIIFGNIISNAYKYTNPENASYLKIKIDAQPTFTEVTFKDNGIGIKAEYVDKIFNMFFRATERSQGSGLGMYIVQQAVEKLHGHVRIDSTFGRGTKIILRLPKIVR